ncbi:hypothetical protein BBK36DRAFT_164251 [Trichoderma citrinoviride]|uniref:Uncharacterized protein n=1 Tax=Trichoderma citrinoviride TaxID=58853 RepID=A0A2T4B9C7_9HYPO|nr:hypothetical protein BBK36DRAFT_164251 [Trichoderma citrinoviride]PTB65898.1 hypothetical protein BBK36DRAFT_164251 [Trichoderma citrinoviride]
MGMRPNQGSTGFIGPTVTAAGAVFGPALGSFEGAQYANPSTPAMMQMSMPMPSVQSTPSAPQMQSLQLMSMNTPMNMSTSINPNLNTGTRVNQNPNMSMPPPPQPYRPVSDGHQNAAISLLITKQPQKHALGSGIITQPHKQANQTETKVLAAQHSSKVAKGFPVKPRRVNCPLLREAMLDALAQLPVEDEAPIEPQPTAAPEAIIIDEFPAHAPAAIPEAVPSVPNLEDTLAARAIPPVIDQERLDKLLVCKHWSWHHMISLCQQVEIMAGNRGNDYITWLRRLAKRRDSRGLWNVYEIDGFLYEIDFNTGEAVGIPRREYIKAVDKVRRKCCAPVVEDVQEEVDEKEEKEEVEEESEEGEGREGGEEGENEDENEEVNKAEEEEEEDVMEEDEEVKEQAETDKQIEMEEQDEVEEEEEEGEVMEEMEVVEVSQALVWGTRSFLDLLDDNGDVLPLEAWEQELRDGLSV